MEALTSALSLPRQVHAKAVVSALTFSSYSLVTLGVYREQHHVPKPKSKYLRVKKCPKINSCVLMEEEYLFVCLDQLLLEESHVYFH